MIKKIATAIFALCIMVGMALPASAGTEIRIPPQMDGYTVVHWAEGGGKITPGVWYQLTVANPTANCVQWIKIGSLYNYAFAVQKYISGNCAQSGPSLVYGTSGSGLFTNPEWGDDYLHRQFCSAKAGSGDTLGCTQLTSGPDAGAVWDQPTVSIGNVPLPYTNLVGVNVVICSKIGEYYPHTEFNCSHWNFGIF